jgi:hypothetical protein
MRFSTLAAVAGFAATMASLALTACGDEERPVDWTRPVATVGPDQEVEVGDRVTITGDGHAGKSADPVTFLWTLRSLPPGSGADLESTTDPTASFVADRPGVYVGELVVATGGRTSQPAVCVVVALPQDDAPIAVAGGDVAGSPHELLSLSAVQSYDPMGGQLSFRWTLADKPAASSATLIGATTMVAQLEPDVAGVYRVDLVVEADGRVSAPDRVTATVNTAPSAVVGRSQTTGIGYEVTFDGSASFDPDGDPLTYHWRLATQPPASAASLTTAGAAAAMTPDLGGSYEVELTVSDWLDLTVATVSVYALSGSGPAPVVVIDAPRQVVRGQTALLSAFDSHAPDGASLSFDWQLTRKPDGSEAEISAYSSTARVATEMAGMYVVELRVSSTTGGSAVREVSVEAVQAPPASNVLDPGEVYVIGSLSDYGSQYVLAHWASPNSYSAALPFYLRDNRLGIDPAGGHLLYIADFENLLREYHADGGPGWLPGDDFPANSPDNDAIIRTPPCDADPVASRLGQFLVSPEGAIFHTCQGNDSPWYDAAGDSVPGGLSLVHVGFDGLALGELDVINLVTGASTPITGLPAPDPFPAPILAVRALPTGFWLVLGDEMVVDAAALWLVDVTGTATLVGVYPPPASGSSTYGRSSRLDASGRLYQIGSAGGATAIIRRTVDTDGEVVFVEDALQPVSLHISSLVTGP